MESRRQEGGQEEAPSEANIRYPYGENGRATSEPKGSSPSGANRIAPSGSPSEAEGSDWLGWSLVVYLGQS